jgi:6-phosphogluconolactonase
MLKIIFRLLGFVIILGFLSCRNIKTSGEKKFSETSINTDMKTMFVGTYTKKEGHVDGKADGIYTLYQNKETGDLKMGKTVAEVINPSFVKVSKDSKFLFAVSELGPGDAESGFVYSYKIKKDDSLEEISKVSTESFAPAHVAIDQLGKYVFVANYTGGVVMMYKVNDDGSLSKQQRINLENPEESHAHSVTISADNDKAYIADLGNDKIWIYDFDESKGSLFPSEQPFVSLPDGAGPRHFILSKNGKFAYSINELNNTVSVFKVRGNGGLEAVQHISTLPEGFSGNNSGADIHLHPSGEFLYASNRGHNSIVSFRVDPSSGKLDLLKHTPTLGKTPRNFAISPQGSYLYVANQDSGNVSTFIIKADGSLEQKGVVVEAKTPVSLEFSDR